MMKGKNCAVVSITTILAAWAVVLAQPAWAATWCVNPGGTSGCLKTISAAVSAASPNDTINVAPGTYKEDVVISKPLSLIGADRHTTAIDATGLANGIYVDGIDNSGLSHVVVTGFTVENANFEGILVTNASFVTIWDNDVTNNDKGLNVSAAMCPGQPKFETSESDDCGEGIHFIGVDHSTLSNNISENNSGGILLTDETAATQDNLVGGNVVRNNPFDCGITLASHPPFIAPVPLGVVHNTIANNVSFHNGYQVPGAGAGVGIFTFLPGGTVSGNLVIHNQLLENGLPGVAFHAHTPGEDLNDNIIVGNYISGNGADTADAATPGPTGINVFGVSPITGTVISENSIDHEDDEIVINTPTDVDIHLNNFLDNSVGIDGVTGTSNATENWWGCPGGPGTAGCATVAGAGVSFSPWLTTPFHAEQFRRGERDRQE
jgi:nitrous oxidase accessory protein NosD